MKKISKVLLTSLALSFLGNFLLLTPVAADNFELLKSKDFGTVYYIDGQGIRHPFPNEITYSSWYGNDFSKVIIASNELLAEYPLGKNITIRPGTFLVKVRTAPQVYAIEQGGVLRELQNEGIAEAIYGENWAKRVVDVPDVFFNDYINGQPIIHDYTVPDSTLYFDKLSNSYFYRNNGILRKFESVEAVLTNRFNLDHALAASRSYYIRERPIIGLDKGVFNPVAQPLTDTRDCAAKELKAAVIFLAGDSYSNAEVEKVQKIKNKISETFDWATNGLSQIDINYPTSVMVDDEYLIKKRNDGTTEIRNEVINTFYDNNSDIFDFIIIFTNFKVPSENPSELANFVSVSNRQEGLSLNILDRSEIYGSQGKLKGIINMGDVNKYNISEQSGLNNVLNIVNHEILHNWSAYSEFYDENGEVNRSLLRDGQDGHWSIYAGFISPLGGSGWIDNGDGTFTSGLLSLTESNLRKFSKLDLYLMGLIPSQLVDSFFYVEPAAEGEIGNVISGQAKTVTIDQIIRANGRIRCSNI